MGFVRMLLVLAPEAPAREGGRGVQSVASSILMTDNTTLNGFNPVIVH